MSADFGAELDAALNAHLEAVRAAADAARATVDSGVSSAAFTASVHEDFEEHDPFFEASPEVVPSAGHGAAVNFDLEESGQYDPGLDDDGIPMPEEIPGN